jgi:heme-degrading monooxygenase HmoA
MSHSGIIFHQPAGHHLAQVNFATAIADLDDPVMAGFVDALAAVNGIAERSPGFVWRLKDRDEEAAALAILGDPRETFTLSVWQSAADLEFFAWNTVHRRFMKNRHRWFLPPKAPFLVMWWVPAGTIPTFPDALARLERLRDEGPSESGFGWDNLPGTRVWQTASHPPV